MPLFRDNIIPQYWFIFVFGLKIISGVILTSIYTYYYPDQRTSDIYKYFNDSKIMFEALNTNPSDYFKMLLGIENDNYYFNSNYYDKMENWYRAYNSNLVSDSHTVIRFNAFVRIFSFGHFHVHNIFINFLSLVGLVSLFKAFGNFFTDSKKMLFYIIFFIPSVLFWGSGLLKEGILFFALGIFILHFFHFLQKASVFSLLAIIISLAIIIFTKFYIVIALFPGCLGWILYKKVLHNKAILSYLISFSIIALISLYLKIVSSPLNPFHLIIKKQQDFIYAIDRYKPKNLIYIPKFEGSMDIILYTPQAILNALFRPFIGEYVSLITLANALENLGYLLWLILPIIFFKKPFRNKSIFFFCLSFSLTLLAIIGLTTPILGAFVRYKIPALIFMSIGLLTTLNVEKMKLKLPFLCRIL